jgi:hypothetical protein
MAALTTAQVTAGLKTLGFRIRNSTEYKRAVSNFQAAWNLGPALVVDGDPGPKTDAALSKSVARHKAGQTDLSTNYSFAEFRCKCGGKYNACQRNFVKRKLVGAMEVYRSKGGGKAVTIVSGYRCTEHNKAVGGVGSSQHLLGKACDLNYAHSASKVESWHVFSGIGKSGKTNMVRHVDVRSSASAVNPTVWTYAS